MRIGIYNPYLHSMSGGERYTMTLASHWSANNHVSIFWDDETIIRKLSDQFSLNCSHVEVHPNIFAKGKIWDKLFQTRKFDLLFFLSDGSVPLTFAPYNILHFQIPFPHVAFPFWKSVRYQSVVCNSLYTKNNIDPTVGTRAAVIYPPVDVEKFSNRVTKKHIILSVGRFTPYHQAKKQDVLIGAFRQARDKGLLQGWKLVFAGAMLSGDAQYILSLKSLAKGLPVEFLPNCSFAVLQQMYEQASIYWHAAGFGEEKPELMEHFGITTIEAMAAGCIPIVYKEGGPAEVIEDGVNGYLWGTYEELMDKTLMCLNDRELENTLKHAATARSKMFSKEIFCQSYDRLLERVTKRV